MSSIYLRRRRLNLSVFYGCNDAQSSDIENRLTKAGCALYHLMLTPGVLVELDRNRLADVRSKRRTPTISGLQIPSKPQLHAFPDSSNIEMKIRERLVEVKPEYSQKLDQCQMVLESLTFTTQMASDHVARHQMFADTRIVVETSQENAQMRSIALVTMIFLRLTSVAVSKAPELHTPKD
ncbi:hypothetical protein AAE478_008061 [Parahypoxylon ruwenzoriense]